MWTNVRMMIIWDTPGLMFLSFPRINIVISHVLQAFISWKSGCITLVFLSLSVCPSMHPLNKTSNISHSVLCLLHTQRHSMSAETDSREIDWAWKSVLMNHCTPTPLPSTSFIFSVSYTYNAFQKINARDMSCLPPCAAASKSPYQPFLHQNHLIWKTNQKQQHPPSILLMISSEL